MHIQRFYFVEQIIAHMWEDYGHILFAFVVGKDLQTPNESFMADTTITQGILLLRLFDKLYILLWNLE